MRRTGEDWTEPRRSALRFEDNVELLTYTIPSVVISVATWPSIRLCNLVFLFVLSDNFFLGRSTSHSCDLNIRSNYRRAINCSNGIIFIRWLLWERPNNISTGQQYFLNRTPLTSCHAYIPYVHTLYTYIYRSPYLHTPCTCMRCKTKRAR